MFVTVTGDVTFYSLVDFVFTGPIVIKSIVTNGTTINISKSVVVRHL